MSVNTLSNQNSSKIAKDKEMSVPVKIVIAEKISASAVDQLREPGWIVLTSDQFEGKLAEQLEAADALIVRSAVQADAALLAHAKKLRVIGRAGVGVDRHAGRTFSAT